MTVRVAIFALVFALMSGLSAPDAAAQARTVHVFDDVRALRTSLVGRHIATQIQGVQQQMQAELEAEVAPVRADRDLLQAEVQALSPEQIQQRPDIIQRMQQLEQRSQGLEISRRRKAAELQRTEQQALQPVLQTIQQVLKDMTEEQAIELIINAQSVVFALEVVDLTPEVIRRLDQQMTTTPVNRVRLPDQPPQQGQ
ncbi:MAG: OmpH family outer membrane protein [Maricaulaceae bacterium]